DSDQGLFAPERRESLHWITPAVVSAGLLLWLVYRVSPQALAAASAQLDWPPLCVVFSAMVLDLYLWDCVEKACVRSCAIRGVPGSFATKASKSWKVICSIRFRWDRQSVAPDRSIISLPQLAQRSAKEIFETNLTRVRRLCEAAERCKPGELQWVQSRR